MANCELTWTDSHGVDWLVTLNVTSFKQVPPWSGSIHSCPSDVDWYGYTEVEYELMDVQPDGWDDPALYAVRARAIDEAGSVDFKDRIIEQYKENVSGQYEPN